jgi:NADH-dependent peroxiredoxin subunit F
MLYDLIIIGGGPAGSGAAVYASRKKMKTLLITSEWGGQSVVSETIYNWIGTPTISGAKLAEDLKNHVKANVGEDLQIQENSKVENISKNPDGTFTVKIDSENNKGEEFNTKTILITSGSSRRKLEAKNADKLEHRGLTYCASCDGPIFADQDVVVVGGGNAGFESSAQLLAYCKSVTLLNRSNSFRADAITVEKVLSHPKMKAIKNIDILEILGDKFVEGIIIKDKTTGVESTLKVSGIFVEIGGIPNTSYAKDLVPLDELNRVKIDPWTQKTETQGIWAAGDCTNILYHQNNIATGDAVRALEDIYLHINTR